MTLSYQLNELNKKQNKSKNTNEDHLMHYNFYLIKGEFKHEVRQFQKPYDNQQAEQISLMV